MLVGFAAQLVVVQSGIAQAVRVSVRDSVDGLPVVRALVTAHRELGGAPLHGLTNGDGTVTLRLPESGRWSVSVRRIGLEPRTIAARQVRDGEVVAVGVDMRRIRFALPAARVVAAAGSCARADGSHQRTSALWEQVTLALQASATAERDRHLAAPLRAVAFDRELDRALHLISEKPIQMRRGRGRPFTALDPDSLAHRGYVHRDGDLTLEYFAPDETSLLSEAFARTHCFDTPEADANPALAELRFWPAPSQRVPDIAGTAYVDTVSGALRRIAFRFVNAGSLFPDGTAHAGGDVRFEQLSNGEWIVAGWSIRMPRMVRVSWARGPRLSGYHEVGGAVDTLSVATAVTASIPTPRIREIASAVSAIAPRDTSRSLATGDQVIVGGKLIVATSGPARRGRDWRLEFTERRRFAVGTFRDSTDLEMSAARPALELLPQFDLVSLLIVPEGVPAPPRADDVDLVEAWKGGAPLPVMLPVGDRRGAGQCLVKVFLDAERTSADALRTTSGADIGAIEFYPNPRDVPAGFRRSGNICGTVLLWSKTPRRAAH